MDQNPIKYSDLIKDDGAFDRAIEALKEIERSYAEAVDTIKSNAREMTEEVKKTTSATDEGRRSTEKLSYEARKLKQAQRELKLALSETGATIQDLKNQTNEANTASRNNAKLASSEAGSYNQLAAQLKILVSEYKKLSSEGRAQASSVLDTIVSLKTELKNLNNQMKVNAQEAKVQKEQLDAEARLRAKIKAAVSDQAIELAKLTKEAREATQIAKLKAVIDSEQEGSYNRLSAQYALNKIQLNKMSQAEREATETGKQLEKETYDIYQTMIKLQEATGKHTLSVGNYKKSWDGLGVAVNQVVREIPAAAISINTFFLGISNNIPMLVDEIKRVIEQNKILKAQGDKQISVVGQLFKSIFSLNTLMVAGLTILAMHGDAIIGWVKKAFSGKAAAISLTDALDNVAKELENTNDSYGSNVVTLKQLQSEWSKLKTTAEKNQWIKDNKTEFESLGVGITSVTDAENVFVKNTQAVLNALKYRAKAAAASKLASEQYEKALIKQNEAEVEKLKDTSVSDKILGSLASGYGATGPAALSQTAGNKDIVENAKEQQAARIKGLEDEAKAAEETGDAYFKLVESFNALAKAELDEAGIDTPHKTIKTRTPKDLTNQLNSNVLSIEKKYQDSLTKLEDDEFAKRRQQALANYNKNTADLKNALAKNQKILDENGKNTKKLTDDQIKQIQVANQKGYATLENYTEAYNQELFDIARDEKINELQLEQQSIELKLKAIKKGSEDELKLRLQSIENQKKLALLQNAKLPANQQQSPAEIVAGFNKTTTTTTTDYDINTFDQQQALADAEFNIIKRSEYQKTRFKLVQERDRWVKLVQLAESGAMDVSDTELATMKATIEGLNNQLDNLDSDATFLEKLGFDDNQIKGLEEAANIIIGYIQEIAQAEVDAAQAAVDAAQERVDAAQAAYDAEIEARNNGYANRVSTAKKELQQEKKNQQEKQKILEAAQRRQNAIDTATQISSLVSASALLWKSFAGTGPAAPFLAAAAIAAMWASFGVAKIKARQVASTSEEYGEGGLEFLEGGSHASGNDIDLHTKNKKGKSMRAEGGEAMAIINRRNTRKYKKALPNIIESLNKGTFEDKYLKAFESGETLQAKIFTNDRADIDLTRLEKDVEKIKKQGESKTMLLGDGTVIFIKKNVKRIIKN